MKHLLLTLILLGACTNQVSFSKKKFIIMDSLWRKNATYEEVTESLGVKFKNIQNGIAYSFQDATGIESAHFFDNSRKLIEQFIFLDEKSLSDLKASIPCTWKEDEKMEPIGHTVYSIKKGKCLEGNVHFEFKAGTNLYEVRWKK